MNWNEKHFTPAPHDVLMEGNYYRVQGSDMRLIGGGGDGFS
jgi:hypothetical protein